jgi:hypothetical protein
MREADVAAETDEAVTEPTGRFGDARAADAGVAAARPRHTAPSAAIAAAVTGVLRAMSHHPDPEAVFRGSVQRQCSEAVFGGSVWRQCSADVQPNGRTAATAAGDARENRQRTHTAGTYR